MIFTLQIIERGGFPGAAVLGHEPGACVVFPAALRLPSGPRRSARDWPPAGRGQVLGPDLLSGLPLRAALWGPLVTAGTLRRC